MHDSIIKPVFTDLSLRFNYILIETYQVSNTLNQNDSVQRTIESYTKDNELIQSLQQNLRMVHWYFWMHELTIDQFYSTGKNSLVDDIDN